MGRRNALPDPTSDYPLVARGSVKACCSGIPRHLFHGRSRQMVLFRRAGSVEAASSISASRLANPMTRLARTQLRTATACRLGKWTPLRSKCRAKAAWPVYSRAQNAAVPRIATGRCRRTQIPSESRKRHRTASVRAATASALTQRSAPVPAAPAAAGRARRVSGSTPKAPSHSPVTLSQLPVLVNQRLTAPPKPLRRRGVRTLAPKSSAQTGGLENRGPEPALAVNRLPNRPSR